MCTLYNHYTRSGNENGLYKNVLRYLNKEQEEQHVQVCHGILGQIKTKLSLQGSVITGVKLLIFHHDLITMHQSFQWKSWLLPRPKKVRMSKSKLVVILIAFFDVRDIVHAEFLPQG